MRLSKITPTGNHLKERSNDDSNFNGSKKQQQESSEKREHEPTSRKLRMLNELLEEGGLSIRIKEVDSQFFYVDVNDGATLGALTYEQLNELYSSQKIASSENERKSTYGGDVPVGNFIDVDL